MNLSELLKQMPEAPPRKCSAMWAEYIYNMPNKRPAYKLSTKRLIAAWFSCARAHDIDAGIDLTWIPAKNIIKITYLLDKKTIEVPIMDASEFEIAEKLFGMFLEKKYELRQARLLNNNLRNLTRRHKLTSLFGIEIIPSTLRSLRIYALIKDYNIPLDVVHGAFMGGQMYDHAFKAIKPLQEKKAETYLKAVKSYIEEE